MLGILYTFYGFDSPYKTYTSDFNPCTNMIIFPDVMNKINVLEKDMNGFHSVTMDADSFPNFPGFPKHVAGTSNEGGAIYLQYGFGPRTRNCI